MSVLVLSALSASTIGIFLFYKPNSKAGNGFRWAIAPMGTVVARQLSQNGFTEATLVTSLLVFVVLMLMLWPFGYIIYKKKADTNDQQKIIAKKDIDMGLRGGDTMKSSDDDIANEISSSEMSDYEETVRDLKTGDFYDERPDTIYDPLDSDWKTAKEFHAGLAEIDTKLSQISWRLAYSFRAHMLETKDYGNYRQVADNLREQFFNIYFGNNNKIVQLGKKLLTNKERDAALSLNQAVRVIGDEIDYYFAVDKILWKCKRPQLLLNALNIVPPSFEIKLSEEDHAFILTTPIYSSKKFTSLTDVTNEIANVLQAHADKQFGYFVFGFVIVLVGLIFFVTFSF